MHSGQRGIDTDEAPRSILDRMCTKSKFECGNEEQMKVLKYGEVAERCSIGQIAYIMIQP